MRRKDREVTDQRTIRTILDRCKTCRVAMGDGEELYLVPLSYGYTLEDGTLTLWFHSAREGRKLDLLRRDPRVCFEISREGEPLFSENPCNSNYRFSSLIGWGEVTFVDDPAEACRGLALLYTHQTGRQAEFTPRQAEKICIYKIVSTTYTAKQLEPEEF